MQTDPATDLGDHGFHSGALPSVAGLGDKGFRVGSAPALSGVSDLPGFRFVQRHPDLAAARAPFRLSAATLIRRSRKPAARGARVHGLRSGGLRLVRRHLECRSRVGAGCCSGADRLLQHTRLVRSRRLRPFGRHQFVGFGVGDARRSGHEQRSCDLRRADAYGGSGVGWGGGGDSGMEDSGGHAGGETAGGGGIHGGDGDGGSQQ
ncbi:hypothetical protein [Alsobacter sp. SYSU BS001988]